MPYGSLTHARQFERGGHEDGGQEEHGDELRHEAEDEVQPDRPRVRPAGTLRPAEEMPGGTGIRQDQGGFHVVAAQAVLDEQRFEREEHEQGDCPAHPPAHPPAKREDVEERQAAERRVPEAETEVVVGEDAGANRQGDQPEFQRRLLDETTSGFGENRGFIQSPVSTRLSAA